MPPPLGRSSGGCLAVWSISHHKGYCSRLSTVRPPHPCGLSWGRSAWQTTPSWTVYRLACHRLLPWLRVTFAMVPDAAWPGSDQCEAGSDPRGHLGVTWGVYLCAGKPPLADIILSHPPDLTRCDSVIGLAIPAMSGHVQYRGAASGDLYIRIS